MRTFEYIALSPQGNVVTGRQRSESELALDRELELQGLILTKAKAIARVRGGAARTMSRAELVGFTTQLGTVISAGVPIVDGLRDLAKRMRTPAARFVVEELVRDLEAGHSLSEAMTRQQASFPEVYRASVAAGELSGHLPKVLRRMAKHLEWVRAMRATTIQALIYPCLLTIAVMGLITVLITFVLPRITAMFPAGPEMLPDETKLLLAISDFAISNWPLLIGALFLAVGGFIAALRIPRSRRFLSLVSLRIPRFGEVARMLATSKFCGTASTLQNAGCDVYQVLTMSGKTCGNAFMAERFFSVANSVSKGQTITESMEHEEAMDPLMVQMVGVGERTGDLGASFEKLAEYFDEEVPRVVKWFLSFLEPAILVVGGVVVAFVLLASILPVFTMYENL